MWAALGPGEVVGGRYAIDALVARGTTADTYRGRDAASDRPVTIKAVPPGTTDARRFEADARLLAGLEHPNLVKLLVAGLHGETGHLVFEQVAGPTVTDRLIRGRLDVTQARRVGRDVAQALAYLHAHGVVHQDVKPSTVVLAERRTVLRDLGVARLTGGTRPLGTTSTSDTTAYLAPEQLGRAEVTGAADVYALGLVLVEALSGRHAFTGTQHGMVAVRRGRDPQIDPDLPRPWTDLLRAMTARDPEARPDAATVAARLASPPLAGTEVDTEVDTEPIEVVAAADTTRPPRHRAGPASLPPTNWTVIGLLAAILVVVGLAAVVTAANRGADAPDDEAAPIDSGFTTPTISSTGSTSTSTSTSTASTTVPTTDTTVPGDPVASPAATCADLDAQEQALDDLRQQIDETYRHDRETRQRLRQDISDQRDALAAERQALGC
jgi:serine/threonine protein kinase